MYIVLLIASFITILSTLIPISKSKYWMIRAFDFPRLQIFLINILLLVLSISTFSGSTLIYIVTALLIAVLIDVYRIFPYTAFYPKDSKSFSSHNGNNSKNDISLMCYNVLIENSNFKGFIDLVNESKPNVILIVEVDDKWKMVGDELKSDYPYFVEWPQDNGYGMCLYSQFELVTPKVEFLTDPLIPSVFTHLKLNNHLIQLIAIHPRPPGLIKSTSDQRDGELVRVANYVRKLEETPTIVIGDFNDVAWSHSSRKFLRTSNLKDPRIGRGFYNTFPVKWPLFRYPLDHIFHSDDFRVRKICRLADIGSDHFPVRLDLVLDVN